MTSLPHLGAFLDQLSKQGWAVSDSLIPRALWEALIVEIREYQSEDALRPAAFGRGAGLRLKEEVRGDQIRWLSATDGRPAEKSFLTFIDQLMTEFRQELYVPVRDYEAHFAVYPPGKGYEKHLDRFRDADERELSTVLFLNPDWLIVDEGELLLYDPEHPDVVVERILPVAGRFIVFRADRIPHQVLSPKRTRYSIAGWMRRSTSSYQDERI